MHRRMAVETSTRANGASSATSQNFPVFPMATGDGEYSYSKNSQFQAFLNEVPRSALDELLEKMTLPSGTGPVRVADLGSSSGPNTISTVSHIVEKLKPRMPKDVEFQAYFNDVPSNDFNCLFQLLSSDSRAKNFYAVGAPGSYLERLFPRSSIHVFHSAVALHWMSKIPDEVLDKESPAYNKGQVWHQHSRAAVAKAYQREALLELKSLLQARAAELVPGGLMFLSFSSRQTSEPHETEHNFIYYFQEDFNEILLDLVAEGLVTEQQLDTFNLPLYHRSREDIIEALESCGPMFKVEMIKLQRADFSEAFSGGMAAMHISKKLSAMFKAILNPMVSGHFGINAADVIWQRYEKLVEKKSGTRSETNTICSLGVVRK
ncbi:unnamed protein product [Calypogeia fissa]